MSNPIVIINVSTQFAPGASTLQGTGVVVSQGGTSITPGTKQLITQGSDLTPLLVNAINISGIVWASNVVTATLVSPHGIPVGETVNFTILGVTPSGYNGTFAVTATTTNAVTYALATNPGTASIQGSAIATDEAEDLAAITTFFAQGATAPIYILELGAGNPAAGVTALTTYIANNPLTIYSYLVPREWATEPTFPALVSAQSGDTACTYFFVTFNESNFAQASAFAGMKAFFGFVEAPTVAATEFSVAAVQQITLNRNPSAVNKVPPLLYSFLVGVTPYAWTGPQVAQFKSLNLSYADTGSEGNITNTILKGGNLGSSLYYNFWWATDWAMINVHVSLANAVINGSNNTINPLYYDQPGIDTLQAVAQNTLNAGVTYGLLLGPVTVAAVTFGAYTQANPSAYAAGTYGGLSCVMTPQNGFTQVVFNLQATSFA